MQDDTIKKLLFKPIEYPDLPVSIGLNFSKLIVETNGSFDPRAYQAVVQGKIILYVARNLFSKSEMESVVNAFYCSPDITKYNVFPPINRVGTPLYLAKAGEKYFSNAQSELSKVNKVYKTANTPNFIDSVIHMVKLHFEKQNIMVRPAVYKSLQAFYGIIREWPSQTNKLGYASEIHEDRLQQRLQQQFETSMALHYPLVSNCVYFKNGRSKGELILYDLRPSLDYAKLERLRSKSKYGFSQELVSNVQKIIIRPGAGDFIAFNSSFMHAVNGTDGIRITATFYTAPIPHKDKYHIIYWS